MWIYLDNIYKGVMSILTSYPNSIIAIANIILILFIFIQLRGVRKPIIITKTIPFLIVGIGGMVSITFIKLRGESLRKKRRIKTNGRNEL
jgi:hypothetical protein